ncbi:DUF2848 family protein [Hydrogenibacillus sp. N12]|nr:DUF2848 family protein [Hydrogenibacillus sp. N12]
MRIRSFISEGGKEDLYQDDTLGSLLRPEDLIEEIERELKITMEGLVVFSGTISSLGGEMRYGEAFKIVMDDPVLSRRIEHRYVVQKLPGLPETK